jgi:uroporphyrinogen decarboxylase
MDGTTKINDNMTFQPDYTNILKVLHNQRPDYLPLYEHHIDAPFISKVLGKEVSSAGKSGSDLEEHYRTVTNFWKDMTYDAFDYEAAVCEIFPGHGAIMGGEGPIQNRDDFEKYPFDELPAIFWKTYTPHLEAIRKAMPAGMKAFGGCGYGIFESAQDLVGYTSLCMMQYDDPDLFGDVFNKIGDLYTELWTEMVSRYSDIFVFFRMGDDLGFHTNTLLEPDTIRQHIIPQYKRIIDIVHGGNKKFLLHSCGCIFDVMDDLIAIGIDAKHSNEKSIAPFTRWIEQYNDRIGLFGGFDMNDLILNPYDTVYQQVLEEGTRYRSMAKGYGLGSGNSIPDYASVDGFMAMVDAVKEIRRREKS